MPAPSPRERQQALSALARLGTRDLATIWRKLNLSAPDKLADPLAEVLAAISERYGAAAASLAADWYDEARDDAQAAGRFSAVIADGPDTERMQALSRWGVGPLFGAAPDGAAALTLIAGGLQRIVLDQARDTTAASVALDPAKPRFARHASANACAFCALMATRGAAYTSEEDALRVTGHSLGGTDYRKMRRMGTPRGALLAGLKQSTRDRGGRKGRPTKRPTGSKYHDDCHCVAIEVFPGMEYAEAPYVSQWRQAYEDTNGGGTKATLAEMRQTLGTN
jgi:hypothetical protein